MSLATEMDLQLQQLMRSVAEMGMFPPVTPGVWVTQIVADVISDEAVVREVVDKSKEQDGLELTREQVVRCFEVFKSMIEEG